MPQRQAGICGRRVASGCERLPVLHYLLPDHLDVFEALHAADVVHQDVRVGIPNPPAAQVQPLLKYAEREGNI